ncbi:MAG: DUF6428 family protein [Verrucomicrobiota bacterium]
MTVRELREHLEQHPDKGIQFRLPEGTGLATHAHVSEVARIEKRFIDCGGVLRNDRFCRLQTWVADDVDHRLGAAKLLGILDKAKGILESEDLDVDVEHEVGFVTQMPLKSILVQGDCLTLQLEHRHTDCLAQDRCLPKSAPAEAIGFRKPTPRS